MRQPRLYDGDLMLRSVEPRDIEAIRQWRNTQMDVLRQNSVITFLEQKKYFDENIWPEKASNKPKQILLGIEKDGELIGYGGLVHISWDFRRAEISFLLKPSLEKDRENLQDIFSRYLFMIQELAFEDLQLHKLTTETYGQRIVHIQILEATGFKIEGRLREHVIVGGEFKDSLVHSVLSNEWKSHRQLSHQTGVLVTSASRKVSLIRALKQVALRLDNSIKIIAGDNDAMAIARLEADDFWQMPMLKNELSSELINECRNRKISVILPTRDGELDIWARFRSDFEKAGIEVIVSSPEGIMRCRDKLLFSSFGHEAGLPIIPAAITPDLFGDKPLVVKERFGSGSRGIGLRMNRYAALEHASNLENPIFQPFVDGPEISIDGWIDKFGKVVGVVLRHRDRILSGESQITTTFTDFKLEKQAIRVLTALKLRGPVVMQAILANDQLQVIECNPRFGGASTASIAAGLDSLYWSLGEAMGNVVPPSFNRSTREIRQIRIPFDRVAYGPDF
jgi:carbamoyl-phosphate synthase large subunit